jgi:hypothetical protein
MPCVLAQAPSRAAASGGMTLVERAQAGGWYPLLVIGGILALAAVFVLLVRMKRDS